MALVFSSCGLGAVMNLGALKTYVSYSDKKFLACKKSKIVASNQGTKTTASDSALVATEPLTKEDLIAFFSSGCKPKEMWRYHYDYPLLFFSFKVLSCPSSPFVSLGLGD